MTRRRTGDWPYAIGRLGLTPATADWLGNVPITSGAGARQMPGAARTRRLAVLARRRITVTHSGRSGQAAANTPMARASGQRPSAAAYVRMATS